MNLEPIPTGLTTFLHEHPVLLSGIDLFAKSMVVLAAALLVSHLLKAKSASSSLHLLLIAGILQLLLMPFVAPVLHVVDKDNSLGTTFLTLTVVPGSTEVLASASASTLSWSTVLISIYLIPCCYLLFRLLSSLIAVARISRRARVVVEKETVESLRTVAASSGLSRNVVLKQSSEITSPFSFGLLTPEIILPVHASEWSASTLEDVLIHEVSHIRRLDWLSALLCHVVTCLYWINPLCWVAARMVNEEAEKVCDAAVLKFGKKNTEYAEHLLLVARQNRDKHRMLVQMIVDQCSLSKRINQILENNMKNGTSGKFVTALGSISLLLVIALGNIQLAATQAQQSAGDEEELFPLFKPIPQYPSQAAEEGVEGWVQVRFTINTDGDVSADSIEIVDEEPPGVFSRSAVRAAKYFKFSPRRRSGVEVEVPNVQYVFRYVLEERQPSPFSEDYGGRLPPPTN